MNDESTVAKLITEECAALRDMLIEKNRKYGNSAIEPMRIASKASPEEQILVRFDDKLSRLRSSQADDNEDVWSDLIGYGILLRVCRKLKEHKTHPYVGRRVANINGLQGTVESMHKDGVCVRWDDGAPPGVFSTIKSFTDACRFVEP